MEPITLSFIRSLFLTPILDGAKKHYGINDADLCLPIEIYKNPMNLIPTSQVNLWFEQLAQHTKDPLYLLTISDCLSMQHLGMIGSWFTSSPDFVVSFRRINYGISNFQSGASFFGNQSGKIIKWCYVTRAFTGCARFQDSLRVAITMKNVLTEYLGKTYRPLRVKLSGPALNRSHVEQFFGCEVEWNAPQTEVWINISVLAHEGKNTLSEYRSLLMPFHQFDDYLNMPQPDDQAKTFYEIINYCRYFGYPTLSKAAECLGISTWQLKRRLMKSGWNFTTVTSYVLGNLAIQKMMQGQPLPQIAHELGYRTLETFSKSFKKNRGKTPRQYLQMLEMKK